MAKVAVTKELMGKLVETILFMEQFYDVMKKNSTNHSFQFTMNESQKKKWLSDYYPALVSSNIVVDDRFFFPDGRCKNYGVGNDGIMSVSNYCNFMYQLYKTLVNFTGSVWQADKEILACIYMLEPYVWYYVGKSDITNVMGMSDEHMKLWKEQFYPDLVESKKIPDYSFFDEENKNTGIGADGYFNGTELLHFLYQCYKYICNPNFTGDIGEGRMMDLINKTLSIAGMKL